MNVFFFKASQMTESSSPIGIKPSLGSSPTYQKLQCKTFVWFCIAASFDTVIFFI